MPRILPNPIRVAVIVPTDGQLLGVLGMVEAFDAANRIRTHHGKQPLYGIDWFSLDERVRTRSGLTFYTHPLSTLESADMLVVGGRLENRTGQVDKPLVGAVLRVSPTCDRVVSVCVGASILAAAGLLHERRATTHWLATQSLATQAPTAVLVPNVLYTEDQGIFCSAGATAGIDLALHLIRLDGGPKLALAVAKTLVVFSNRPGGQSQFAVATPIPTVSDDRIRAVVACIVETPGTDHRVPKLAKRAGMSPRTFARRFKNQTGTTPSAFVQTVRIQAARRALELGDQPVDTIASDVGMGGAEALRRAFLRHVGVTPGAYRQRFGSAHKATR